MIITEQIDKEFQKTIINRKRYGLMESQVPILTPEPIRNIHSNALADPDGSFLCRSRDDKRLGGSYDRVR
jgi:hypothetical protein